MNHCFLCGEYDANEDAHIESVRHTKNLLKHSFEQRPNKKSLKLDEQIKIEQDIINCQQTLEEMTNNEEFDCAKCGRCDFKILNELEQHEVECFNYKREVIVVKQEKGKKLYSSETDTCERCGKVFLHTCKTSLPKHQLNRHQKTCSHDKSKLCRTNIRNFLNIASDEQLQKLNEFMKTI